MQKSLTRRDRSGITGTMIKIEPYIAAPFEPPPLPPSTVGSILSLPPLFSISIPWIKAIDTRIQGSREQEVVLLQVSNEMTDVTCARPSSDHPFLIHCPLETMTRRVSSNKRFQQKEKIGKEKER